MYDGAPLPNANAIRRTFPKLTDKNHSITSPATDDYNCIAWAYDVSNKRMWPGYQDYYWPSADAGGDELRNLIQLYLDAGYEECENGQLEDGFNKVAIYVNRGGPQHAARQLGSGRWTSKLGSLEDIEHDTLDVLEGESYGKATVFLRRRSVQPLA